jgi:hypothetical protein
MPDIGPVSMPMTHRGSEHDSGSSHRFPEWSRCGDASPAGASNDARIERGDAESRLARIEAIRKAIAEGAYPREDQLQLAIRKAIDDLRR